KVEKVEEGKKRGENYITLSDRDGVEKTLRIQRDAAIFGDYSRGDLVAVIINEKYELLVEVLDVRSGKEATGDWDGEPAPGEEPGVVTYIDLTNKAIYIDGKAYVYSDNVVLKTAKGSIIATG